MKRLISWGHEPIDGRTFCVDAKRWSILIGRDSLVLCEERRFKDSGRWDGEDATLYYRVDLGVPPKSKLVGRFGYVAFQYDGFHQVLNLGVLQVSWCHSFAEPLWREDWIPSLRRALGLTEIA